MKQFEKWWKSSPEFKCMLTESCEKCHDDAKLIYREALRFVMRRGMHHYGNDFLALDLCKDIRKELEDETEKD